LDPHAASPETVQEHRTATSLETYFIDGQLLLPDVSQRGISPTIVLNDITGMLDINIGKGFHMQLREEDLNISDLKASWLLDPVWQHEVIQEDSQFIVYSKKLPDGSMEQFHFMAIQSHRDRNMLIRSAAIEEFDKEDVDVMLLTAKTFTWNRQLATMND